TAGVPATGLEDLHLLAARGHKLVGPVKAVGPDGLDEALLHAGGGPGVAVVANAAAGAQLQAQLGEPAPPERLARVAEGGSRGGGLAVAAGGLGRSCGGGDHGRGSVDAWTQRSAADGECPAKTARAANKKKRPG